MQEIVVTGLGCVSPLGNDVASTWEGLLAGRSGIGPISQFDPAGLPVGIAGEVRGFDPEAACDRKTARRMSRFSQLALAASVGGPIRTIAAATCRNSTNLTG